jgi:hypothetical protein
MKYWFSTPSIFLNNTWSQNLEGKPTFTLLGYKIFRVDLAFSLRDAQLKLKLKIINNYSFSDSEENAVPIYKLL